MSLRSSLIALAAMSLAGCSTIEAATARLRPDRPAVQPVPAIQPVPVAGPQPKPTLVVTIVVDQFSANLFNQYRSRYTGGLRRMADQGLVHINGYQTHGLTETCPGHSTVLTGKHPTETGIPANDWVNPVTGHEDYCLGAPQNHLASGDDTADNGPVVAFRLSGPTGPLSAVSGPTI